MSFGNLIQLSRSSSYKTKNGLRRIKNRRKGIREVRAADRERERRDEEELKKRPGFRSFRVQDSSLLAFDFAGVHHSDMVTLLAGYGIALRAGQHCAQPLLAALGVNGTLRASFAPYNTQSDVDALVVAVDRALEILVD